MVTGKINDVASFYIAVNEMAQVVSWFIARRFCNDMRLPGVSPTNGEVPCFGNLVTPKSGKNELQIESDCTGSGI